MTADQLRSLISLWISDGCVWGIGIGAELAVGIVIVTAAVGDGDLLTVG